MKNNPYLFPLNYNFNGISVKYTNLVELGQSGIQIGKISLDNYTIQNYDFGGPLIFKDNYIFLPLYKRSFFKSGFILAFINTKNYKVYTMESIKPLIWLDLIEENKIFFYEDIEKIKRTSYNLFKNN